MLTPSRRPPADPTPNDESPTDTPHTPMPRELESGSLVTPFKATGPVPPERSRLEQLRRVARPDLVRAAIEQLLSWLQPTELAPDDFDALDLRYGLTPDAGRTLRLEIWREVLDRFCADRVYTPTENAYLTGLRDAFGLPTSTTEPLRMEAAAAQFRSEVAAVIVDHRITTEEREHLSTVAALLGLPLSEAQAAVENTARRMLANVRTRAVTGPVISRAGIAWIRSAAANLGLTLSEPEERELADAEAHWARIDAVTAARVQERATEASRLRAAIAHIKRRRTIPTLGTSAPMFGSVPCHLSEPALLWGWRPHPTNRFESGMPVLDDTGRVLLTANEWCFEGSRVIRRVPLKDLIGAVTHPDGLVLQRARDEDLRLGFDCPERALLTATALCRLRHWDAVPHDPRSLVELGIAPSR